MDMPDPVLHLVRHANVKWRSFQQRGWVVEIPSIGVDAKRARVGNRRIMADHFAVSRARLRREKHQVSASDTVELGQIEGHLTSIIQINLCYTKEYATSGIVVVESRQYFARFGSPALPFKVVDSLL
jgi:hypothetical protein